MPITYRQDIDRRLSISEMDNNFHYLEDQLSGLTSSNSQTPTFAQVTQEGNTTTQSFYQSITSGSVTINTGVFGSYGSSSNPITNGVQYVQNGVPVGVIGFVGNEPPAIRLSITSLQKEFAFYLPFEKENPSYPETDSYTLSTTDDLPKIFKGVFNQTGSGTSGSSGLLSRPVVQEYYNNTGYEFTNWERTSTGVYFLSVELINGASFSYINVGQNYLEGLSKTSAVTYFNAKSDRQDYYVYTFDDGVPSDSIAYNMFIEIGLK
jgi:hypothetical protein